MKSFVSTLAFGLGASAAVLRPSKLSARAASDCCFGINVSGGAQSGPLGQLIDGQNRVGPGYDASTFCYNSAAGTITDEAGRGCDVNGAPMQYQCDLNLAPSAGITIDSNGVISHNGSSTWYECMVNDNGVYNIYTEDTGLATKCSQIQLTTSGGNCSAPVSTCSASTIVSTVTLPAQTVTVSGAAQTQVQTVSGAAQVQTVSVSGAAPAAAAASTVTVTSQLAAPAASTVTVTNQLPAPAASTVTVTSQLPAPAASTVTITAQAGASEITKISTVVSTLPAATITEVSTLSAACTASTVYQTAVSTQVEVQTQTAVSTEVEIQTQVQTQTAVQTATVEETTTQQQLQTTTAVVTSVATQSPSTVVVSQTPTTVVISATPSSSSSVAASSSTVAPVSSSSTVAPVSKSSTVAPVSSSSTVAPVSSSSTVAPVSKSSTVAPISSSSTVAPTSSTIVPSSTSVTSTSASASATACAANLNGTYQYPHLIVPVSSASPNSSYGTSYFGQVNSTTSTIFNFDIPSSYQGETCSLLFLFPLKSQLETSDYTLSSAGSIVVKQLSSPATESTTYNTVPSVTKNLGTFPVTEGSSTVVVTSACAAGQRLSYEFSAAGGLNVNWFNDWNPSPLGVFIRECTLN